MVKSCLNRKLLIIFMILLSSLLILSCRNVGKYSFETVSLSEGHYDTLATQIIKAELLSESVLDFAGAAYDEYLFDADARVGYSRFESEFDDIFDLLWDIHADEGFCGYYNTGEFYDGTPCFANTVTDRICINIDRHDLGDEEIISCLPHEGAHFLMGLFDSPHYGMTDSSTDSYDSEDNFILYLNGVQSTDDYPLLLSDLYDLVFEFEDLKEEVLENTFDECLLDFAGESTDLLSAKNILSSDGAISEREIGVYEDLIGEAEISLEENKDYYGCQGDYFVSNEYGGAYGPENINSISGQFRNVEPHGVYSAIFFDHYGISRVEIEGILEEQGFCEEIVESCEMGYANAEDSWGYLYSTSWADEYEVSSVADVEFDFTGSIVVTTSEDEHFYVFDTDDGTIIQSTHLEDIMFGFKGEAIGDKLYFSNLGLREYDFSNLDFSTDDEGNSFIVRSSHSTLIENYGGELFYDSNGEIRSYDPELFEVHWEAEGSDSSESFGETFLVGDNLFAISNYPGLYSFDVSNINENEDYGYPELNWNYMFSTEVSRINSLSVDNNILYISAGGVLYAFDSELGDLLWTEDFGSDIIYALEAQDGRLYFGYGNSFHMAEVDSSGISIAWEYENAGTIWNKAIVEGGIVYFGSNDGQFYALAAETGASFWTYDSGATIKSTPVICEGNLFFGNEMGQMIAIDIFDGSEVWRASTAGEIEGTPVCYSYE